MTEAERQAADAIERALLSHGARAAAALLRGGPGAVAAVADPADEVRAALEGLYGAVIPERAAQVYGGLAAAEAKAIGDWADLAAEYLGKWGADALRLITGTTRRMVARVVALGVREGMTTDEMADLLMETWAETSRERAETIVRTESTGAMGYAGQRGAERAASQFGLRLVKVWHAAHDDRTRRRPRDEFDHLAADGQAVPLDQPFVVNGEALMHPGDRSLGASAGNLIRCRCAVSYVPLRAGAGDGQAGRAPVLAARSWPSVAKRREDVWARYPALRDARGREVALDDLAAEYGVSARTVERDWEGRPR